MSTNVETLLARLDRVKRTGERRWMARCPAHDDRHPSLAIRELEDGRVLLHCFAACDTQTVLASVRLTFDDLYPEKSLAYCKRERRPFDVHDVLACLANEATILLLAAAHLAKGRPLSDTDKERLDLAVARIQAATELANG